MLVKGVFIMLACVVALTNTTSVYALEPADYSGQDIFFYSKNAGVCEGSPALGGGDNLLEIYKYMIRKGLTDFQAAGVVGNISQESGGNPINAQKGADTKDPSTITGPIGGGNGWGIIQWDSGSRVIGYAKQAGATGPIYELSTQLDIVWWHMTTETPTSKKGFLEEYKKTTDVESATTAYEHGMEGAGKPRMTDRITAANLALKTYSTGTSTATTDPSATLDSTSATSGSCPPTGSADGASVVSIAQNELAKHVKEWDSNALKYTSGSRWAWCASFVSWVYKESGQTISGGSAGGWLHPSVLEMRSWFKKNGVYFKVGEQVPQPGDIAFYVQAEAKSGQVLGGAHHVNIVETVSDSGDSMTAIGGNQSNQVTKWKVNIKAGQYALVGFGRMK
ncbi:MAG: phage tail tip lysozyme [Candidatus Saccharimonas sp.]